MKPNDKAIDAALNTFHIVSRKVMTDILNAAYAAQFKSEDYAGLVERLRHGPIVSKDKQTEAADALEAALAEREAWKGRHEATAAILKQVETERDALAARLAPVEAIENDKDDPTREYIPLPGGWEIQTKGKGSSYRLLDKKTGERHMILAGDAQFVHDFVTRAAKEINASSQVQPIAPVDDEALVEIAAKAQWKHAWQDAGGTEEDAIIISGNDWHQFINSARATIAAIRPHIEAAERERCANVAELCWTGSPDEIAAAIRSGK